MDLATFVFTLFLFVSSSIVLTLLHHIACRRENAKRLNGTSRRSPLRRWLRRFVMTFEQTGIVVSLFVSEYLPMLLEQALQGEKPRERIAGEGGLPMEKRVTLVLDLDETLVHSFAEVPYGFVYCGRMSCVPKVVVLNKRFVKVAVGLRPFVREFILEASKLFRLVIFTSGEKAYAEPIINMLDTNGVVVQRYYRESCRIVNGMYVKDLTILGGNLQRIAIIDNHPSSYALQPNNGIPIRTWTGNPFDRELFKLLPMLEKLSAAENVQSCLRVLL
mmetsp:Transcript_7656/g.12398  ORF Transcript_7656/g.12398 Transcript_7656/m.12398 type:complete len:275 (-) Transcript_7656:22-846(-)